MKLPLGRRIFLGTTLVVVAVLGSALLATKRRADAAADDASARALGATASSIAEALAGRSLTLLRLTQALVQVPAYVSRIGESLRAGDRANLLDQADDGHDQQADDEQQEQHGERREGTERQEPPQHRGDRADDDREHALTWHEDLPGGAAGRERDRPPVPVRQLARGPRASGSRLGHGRTGPEK